MIRRKKNRLDLQLYKEIKAYFVTICTKDQLKVFTDFQIVSEQLEILNSCCNKENSSVWAYCIMPDHLHLLLMAEENSDLIKFVRIYKQLSGYGYMKVTGKALGQKSFYDHVLRREENVTQAIRYVLENPVRKGIVEYFVDYPYSGSLKFGKEVFKL